MAKAILIEDDGLRRVYQINGTTNITLILNEDQTEIAFFNMHGVELDGEFCFDDESENGRRFLLRRMYAPSTLKNAGLGRAALQLFKDNTDATIYVRPNDGEQREDGSHLTEDAPAFVVRMMEEGLIEKYQEEEAYEIDIDESQTNIELPDNLDMNTFDDLFNEGFMK